MNLWPTQNSQDVSLHFCFKPVLKPIFSIGFLLFPPTDLSLIHQSSALSESNEPVAGRRMKGKKARHT